MKIYLLISLLAALSTQAFAKSTEALKNPEQGVLCDEYLCADQSGVSDSITLKYLGKKRETVLTAQGGYDKTAFTFSNGIFCDTKEKQCHIDRYFEDGKRSAVAEKETRLLFTGDTFCQPGDIRVYFDTKDGQFDGMSQRGALLTMQNISHRACQVPVRPEMIFSGTTDEGGSVQAQRQVSRAMNPGPVLLPVTLEPGHQHGMMVRWVAGDVYDDSHNCVTTTEATVDLGDNTLHIPAQFHMCAPKGSSEFFNTGSETQ